MGTVYKATSKNDQKTYAVKVLPRRSMWNVRVARRKVRAFEACRHPAVVPFVDVGTAGSMHYLVWPYVEGEGLDKLVQAEGKLHSRKAASYALQVAEALELCHQQALFHGLLKPSNLKVSASGHVYILDFGIGCLLAETEGESLVDTMSTANSVASGLDCASPESIMDPTNLTPAGDQYSLGCVLYYCLTGQFPFPDGSSAEKMMAHQFKEPTPIRDLNPDVPAELVDVVTQLMQKVPENRFANAAAVVEALQPFADLPAASAAAPPPPPRGAGNARSAAAARAPAPPPEKRPNPTVSPSTTTPRPQGNVSLPSRQSLQAAATPAQAKRQAKQPERQPDYYDDESEDSMSWDEKIGQVGLIVIAIAACAAAWAVMTFLL